MRSEIIYMSPRLSAVSVTGDGDFTVQMCKQTVYFGLSMHRFPCCPLNVRRYPKIEYTGCGLQVSMSVFMCCAVLNINSRGKP